jgi:hypothetical protein
VFGLGVKIAKAVEIEFISQSLDGNFAIKNLLDY